VDLVRFELLVAEHPCPAVGMQRQGQLIGELCVHRVIGQSGTESGDDGGPRHRNQHHLGARVADRRHAATQMHFGVGLRQAAQEVVAAGAQDHQCRLVIGQQRRQAVQNLCRGITRHAAIDDFPAGQLGQLHRVGGLGRGAGAVGDRVAERQYDAAGRQRLQSARSGSAAAGRQSRGGQNQSATPHFANAIAGCRPLSR
jgi:hypothetical protein